MAVLTHREERTLTTDDGHPDHFIVLLQPNAPNALSGPTHLAHVGLLEPQSPSLPRGQEDLLGAIGHLGLDERVSLRDVHRDDAVSTGIAVSREHRLFDPALSGGHDEELGLIERLHGNDRGDAFGRPNAEKIDDRAATGRSTSLWDLVHLQPVASPRVGEEEDVAVRRRDEQVFDEILLLGGHPGNTTAASALPTVRADRKALDVARVGYGDHHILVSDQILDVELLRGVDDVRTTFIPIATP